MVAGVPHTSTLPAARQGSARCLDSSHRYLNCITVVTWDVITNTTLGVSCQAV